MLPDKSFYHSHTRNIIIAFGKLFDNITVSRATEDETLVKKIKVPIAYSVKQKFIERIKTAPSLEEGRARFEIVLPRMGFEITSLTYTPERKLTTMQTQRAVATDNSMNSAYVSVPYDLGVEMTIYTKNQDDGFQILEQIIPYFTPDFNVRINEIEELGVIRDLQIRLESVIPDIVYEGPMEQRVTVMWNLNFSIKANYFGYVEKANLIKKTIVSLLATPSFDPLNTTSGTKIITTPVPSNADPSGDFTYMQEFDNIPENL